MGFIDSEAANIRGSFQPLYSNWYASNISRRHLAFNSSYILFLPWAVTYIKDQIESSCSLLHGNHVILWCSEKSFMRKLSHVNGAYQYQSSILIKLLSHTNLHDTHMYANTSCHHTKGGINVPTFSDGLESLH